MAKNKQYKGHHEILGVFFLALGLFFGISLLSYDPADPALNVTSTVSQINNLAGVVGAYTADILFTIFGISAYFMCAILFLISVLQFIGKTIRLNWKEAVAYVISVVAVASIIHLKFDTVHIHGQPIGAGGLFGGLFGKVLKEWVGVAGSYIITLTIATLSLLYATHVSVVSMVLLIKRAIFAVSAWAGALFVIYFERLRKWTAKGLPKIKDWAVSKWKKFRERRKVKINVVSKPKSVSKGSVGISIPTSELSYSLKEPAKPAFTKSCSLPVNAEDGSGPKIFERADTKPKKVQDSQLELAKISQDYVFPPISLLDSPEQKIREIDESALKKNSLLLEKKLKDYGVEGRVTEIHPGPVITMYEYEPAPGVKVGKIVNLEDDLSVTMGGRSVRIVAHLPGKAAIGIEIPNSEREIVWLKDIVNDPKFRRSSSKLTFALGKDIEGHSVITDLAKMPHLLVAGATGSGKSVAVNTMITSILYKSTPEEVRLILIDPKMLELPVYNGIPHLLLPVVTKPRKAILSLQWAVREMERRYDLLADVGVRNIAGYNDRIQKGILKTVSAEEASRIYEANPETIVHTGKLPHIVIIIDELADLMMVATKDIEESITRLAQMARAAGFHLVLATQRPSVDVITGLIKANFPARMSFKVSSSHDSRTILDTVGSEKLLGMGDMLFMPPNSSDLMRLHGAFITEAEISRVVEHTKEQGKPVYDESITEERKGGSANGNEGDEEYDELYDSAVQMVSETKQASISMIQRRFRIGYNRAARLVDKMESEGVVGPADGAKPRQVLISSMSE